MTMVIIFTTPSQCHCCVLRAGRSKTAKDLSFLSKADIYDEEERQVNAAGIYQHISIYLFGSDQGPDEKAADNLFNNDFTSNVFAWKIRQYCVKLSGFRTQRS